MNAIDQNKIISEFRLKPFGSKGWKRGQLFCPDCGRNDKFGVLFLNNGGVARCFYCQTPYPLFRILKNIGREDLLDFSYEYKGKIELPSLKKEKKVAADKECILPLGFVNINKDPYLQERGFTSHQYLQFGVGVSLLDPRTDDKLIFKIMQRGRLAGWLARSRESKEWHHANLKSHKEKGTELILRYRNSENDFSKMLGGLDEITPNTHTIILVEGLFDKANLDRLLQLNEADEVKCCFTFGSDLSVDQVDLIPTTVKEVILMYDPGTVRNIREAGGRLLSMFEVYVALIEKENVDPGNIDAQHLAEILFKMKNFLYFYCQIFLPNNV